MLPSIMKYPKRRDVVGVTNPNPGAIVRCSVLVAVTESTKTLNALRKRLKILGEAVSSRSGNRLHLTVEGRLRKLDSISKITDWLMKNPHVAKFHIYQCNAFRYSDSQVNGWFHPTKWSNIA